MPAATVNGYNIDFKTPYKKESEWALFQVQKPGGYQFNVAITKWPTGNCQLTSVAYANNLLSHTSNNKEDCNAILRECYKLLGMNPLLIIMDVKNNYIPQMDVIFQIIHKHPYTSTNSSQMCLYIVKLQ